MLKINHLTVVLNNKPILNDISLAVNKGEIAVLLGSSGVGKSTLLRVLNNLQPLDAGTVELDGKKLDLAQVNKTHAISMVFQQFNLFDHLTVEQNIMVPLEKVCGKTKVQAHQIAHELLARYGLADKKHKYPAQLSGGQKQRVALARTLALTPQVICLDEPTSALDPMLVLQVAAIIRNLAHEGYIFLIATHDITLLERLPCTIYLMQEGKIIEKARSEDFFAHRQEFPALNTFFNGACE